jgi:hypothetical protein
VRHRLVPLALALALALGPPTPSMESFLSLQAKLSALKTTTKKNCIVVSFATILAQEEEQ